MIKEFIFKNLNHNMDGHIMFNNDINILTGKNGCGKTTIMKLMWYMLSGNFDKIHREIDVERARLVKNDGSYCQVSFIERDYGTMINIEIGDIGGVKVYEKDFFHDDVQDGILRRLNPFKSSLFLPTFRRIEGGFNVENIRRNFRVHSLKDSLDEISDSLSDRYHKFITSISTDDIENLISQKYSEISYRVRHIENIQSKNILNIVSRSTNKETESLEEIRALIKRNNKEIDEVLKPFSMLKSIIQQVFEDKSIKFNKNNFFGNSEKAIYSDKLSAGEKQMLSFMCYNFFLDDSVIFIDEPELSLHTDWQRVLFPILLGQEKNNQFIVATHSPFIYTRYIDKEIMVDNDRGNKYE